MSEHLIAECIVAVNVSVKDQLTFSISVAVGSTIVSCGLLWFARI